MGRGILLRNLVKDVQGEYLDDSEGWEMQAFNGIDWTRFLPAIICVEEWRSPLEGNMEISNYLPGHGYNLRYRIGLSGFYLHVDSLFRY